MPTKVLVNAGQIVINDGSSFLVTDASGLINADLAQGFFVRDTRLISDYEISLNHHQLVLLASSMITHHSALWEFTNPEFPTARGMVPYGRLLVTVRRDIVNGMHEDIDIMNCDRERVEFQLRLTIRSDFADIFQVKSKQLLHRGEVQTTWKDGIPTTEYRNGAFYRGISTCPNCSSPTSLYDQECLLFNIALTPGEKWHTCINHTALADGDVLEPQQTCVVPHLTEAGKVRDEFIERATQLESSNAEVAAYYRQALVDMGALRIKVDNNQHHFWMPAAGIPWFVAVFGRDSLIASLQTMGVYHNFARGTLVKLSELQAHVVDGWRDAQPGKILHEIRQGELAQLHKIPHTPYYGTVDTTPLWIITLAETYSWNASLSMLDAIRFS